MGLRHDLEEIFDFDIVDEFLDHYTTMIDTMEPLIIALSQKEFYEKNVNELFRISHNIKSASGYLNIEILNRFSTMMENTLEDLRAKEGPASEEMINWLLLCRDQLDKWKQNLREDDEKLDKINFAIMNLPQTENR